MVVVATMRSAFRSKFGIPRQSGMVEGVRGEIVFRPAYRNPDALRGLEGFSHIWLLWDFSRAHRDDASWCPTVRPPRLGGNRRMGVWATRSPFRPNSIGLSSVRVVEIRLNTPEGPIIVVEGADLLDGTPIYDIKPYLPFTDCHPDATGGFAEEQRRAEQPLRVVIPEALQARFTLEEWQTVRQLLQADPRPQYQDDATRIYYMEYGNRAVRFRVAEGCVTVTDVGSL
ncbi:MAG: tRNA (N6-threonylcarbamoyladenosine(37)-N6)-methyltransferase TrmO [Bacteroidaceae bacterium]|nr:tRNA (N6-threonylcarbamoyladenosine(37)-N6)-methyltransferase TrmO [Bacteroidaceae bacterium]